MLVIGSATPLRNFTVDHKVPQRTANGEGIQQVLAQRILGAASKSG